MVSIAAVSKTSRASLVTYRIFEHAEVRRGAAFRLWDRRLLLTSLQSRQARPIHPPDRPSAFMFGPIGRTVLPIQSGTW
jgi:hypothetical protein